MLIDIELFTEDGEVNPHSWTFIQNTPGVIGFLGGERPAPLSDEEVNSIVHQIEEKKEVVAPKVMFEPNDAVKVTDGPFMNFSGIIEEVDPERGKLKNFRIHFRTYCTCGAEYWQVERVSE